MRVVGGGVFRGLGLGLFLRAGRLWVLCYGCLLVLITVPGVLCYCVQCVVGGLWCEGFVVWLLAGYVALPTYGWIWDWCGGLLGV